MLVTLEHIPLREVLHFLGWRGTPIEPQLMEQLKEMADETMKQVCPRVVFRRFQLNPDGMLAGTSFSPEGCDIRAMLAPCSEAILMAATLGAESERFLLKRQAVSVSQAVLLDAVMSAAIEAVCDQQEHLLRLELEGRGMYLSDRFSPGYGDMPIGQTKDICALLQADRTIGLTVSSSGIMIPRKSVTAIMGVSTQPFVRRASGCSVCNARETCILRRNEEDRT